MAFCEDRTRDTNLRNHACGSRVLQQSTPSCRLRIGKQLDGYFRFECPHCGELQATVNPKYNLAHCFCCGENTNNIDLMMLQGHDFLTAVSILKDWLNQYRHDLGLPEQSASPRSARDE